MSKLSLFLCLFTFALITPITSFGEEKNWNEVISELRETKLHVTHLVGEFVRSHVDERNLNLLGKNYDFAKEGYFKWAEEAADAVEHNKKIKLNSEKAKEAHRRFTELSDFANTYVSQQEEQNKNVLAMNKRTWDGIKNAAKI